MDAVQGLPIQDSTEMRQEIANTRSAMADKLEKLEDRVINTVQSAQDTVKDSIQSAKDTVASVKRTFDLKHQVEQHPWTMVGGCFLAGLALGHLAPKGRPPVSTMSNGPVQNGSHTTPVPAPSLPGAMQSQLGILEPFHDEIDKVKGIAIGFVLGLLRDSIKESVPELAPKIDDLMNGLTTKLGG